MASRVVESESQCSRDDAGRDPQRLDRKPSNRRAAQVSAPAPAAAGWSFSRIPVLASESANYTPLLIIAPVADRLEREADELATRAMRRQSDVHSHQTSDYGNGNQKVSRTSSPASSTLDGAQAPAIVQEVLSSPGEALPWSLRDSFEARFDRRFAGVRVHHDAAAAESALAVNALAFTSGDHIVFADGEYKPDDSRGQWLIAHELAHTIQHANGSGSTMTSVYREPRRDAGTEPDQPSNGGQPENESPSDTGTPVQRGR